ncbi:MAG: hypothetical protein GQ552_07240 [Flavobacteriaceae bacterium]|nr:hypothetical protein [Flavobacteriaceae bacterium]
MAIQYLLYKNIDLIKYDACISKSSNSRIYALTWYLNCVTDSWGVLVLNDYEAVMPLPKRKKLGINYIYQAPWIQQLGVFSKKSISEELIKDFISRIPKKFVLVDYFFNSDNIINGKFIKERNNYILSLNQGFETIKSNYNKNRKRISNKNFDDFKLNKDGDIGSFLEFYKKQNFNFKTHRDTFERLEKLLKSKNVAINIWTISYNGESIAGLVWLKEKRRITYLLPVANEVAKNNNIPTFLINELIKEHQNTNCILDFEGSMIEGVAQFYKSFGAETEAYYWYKKRLI